MEKKILEVCVDSVESAIYAEQGGAHRLELCSNLLIGGTTPSICLYHEVRKHTTIPIRVLIRPRFGDFIYSQYEYEIIKNEVKLFRDARADGIVIGCLQVDGTLNISQLSELKEIAESMKITIHRAFDMLKNPYEAITQLINLGIDSCLTSGQKQNCLLGMDQIKQYIELSEGKINILVGAGVNDEVIKQFLLNTKATQFHMSGKVILDSQMKYRNPDVNMGLTNFIEYQVLRTDKYLVTKARNVLDQYSI